MLQQIQQTQHQQHLETIDDFQLVNDSITQNTKLLLSMLHDNLKSSVDMNNDLNIEYMFEIKSELKMKDLLKTALNFSSLVLINILNEYYSDNESADDNLND